MCVFVCGVCACVCSCVCLLPPPSPSFCFDQRSACWNGDFDRWKIPITWSNVLRNMRIKKWKKKKNTTTTRKSHCANVPVKFELFEKHIFLIKEQVLLSCPYLWKVFWIFLLNASRQGATRISKQRTRVFFTIEKTETKIKNWENTKDLALWNDQATKTTTIRVVVSSHQGSAHSRWAVQE